MSSRSRHPATLRTRVSTAAPSGAGGTGSRRSSRRRGRRGGRRRGGRRHGTPSGGSAGVAFALPTGAARRPRTVPPRHRLRSAPSSGVVHVVPATPPPVRRRRHRGGHHSGGGHGPSHGHGHGHDYAHGVGVSFADAIRHDRAHGRPVTPPPPPATSHPDIAARYDGPIPGDSAYARALGIEGRVDTHRADSRPTRVTSTRGTDAPTGHYGTHFVGTGPSRSPSPPRWRSTPPPPGVRASAVRRVGPAVAVHAPPYDLGIASFGGGFHVPVAPATGGLIFPGGFSIM